MHITSGVVVRVEEVGVLRHLRAISLHPNLHHKCLEEPTGVREMPFRWTHVRHRLDDAIFGLKIAAKARAEIAHRPVTLQQLFGERTRISLPRANFARAARRLGHEGLGRFQKRSAFLFELFLPRHYHLVVRRLLDPILDKVLADIFLVFDSRGAMSGG